MSKRKPITERTKTRLWTNSGGRCQYRGCNRPLLLDALTQEQYNRAYFAHIVGHNPKSARGNAKLERKLREDYDNLMLLCDCCHRRIDEDEVEGHSVEFLKKMKQKQEREVAEALDLLNGLQTIGVRLAAPIAGSVPTILDSQIRTAAREQGHYLKTRFSVNMVLDTMSSESDEVFYNIMATELKRRWSQEISRYREEGENEATLMMRSHFSVFALAPIPLLMKLGTLLPDKNSAIVFQKHREPDTWSWQKHEGAKAKFTLIQPKCSSHPNKEVALKLSISAPFAEEDVQAATPGLPIWALNADSPSQHVIRTPEDLSRFRKAALAALNHIQEAHGNDVVVHVFPAMPNSAAVEFGRLWQPKAHPKLLIYDRHPRHGTSGGFHLALSIEHS